jgi:hypothetical protein
MIATERRSGVGCVIFNRRSPQSLKDKSGRPESNLRIQLGKLAFYR